MIMPFNKRSIPILRPYGTFLWCYQFFFPRHISQTKCNSNPAKECYWCGHLSSPICIRHCSHVWMPTEHQIVWKWWSQKCIISLSAFHLQRGCSGETTSGISTTCMPCIWKVLQCTSWSNLNFNFCWHRGRKL
jgi:hypothetical protein